MSSDESPTLIDLLDSFTSINERLNFIETALSAPTGGGEANALAGISATVSQLVPTSSPLVPTTSQLVPTNSEAYTISYWPSLPVGQLYGPLPLAYESSAPAATAFSLAPPFSTTSTLTGVLHPESGSAAASEGWRSSSSQESADGDGTRRGSATEHASQHGHAKDVVGDAEAGFVMDVDHSDSSVLWQPGIAAQLVEPGTMKLPRGAQEPLLAPMPAVQQHQQQEEQQPEQFPEALPKGFLVTGRATLQEELDSWTIPRGYSMRINGTRSHGQRQKIRMVCFRGGRSRLRPKEERPCDDEPEAGAAEGARRRRKPTIERLSKKCECPFRFELVEVSPGADKYAVHYTNDGHMQHNHAAADLMLDPRARKLPTALKAQVDQWLCGGGDSGSSGSSGSSDSSGQAGKAWAISKIQAELRKRGYSHVQDFDLRNRKRALLHKERMEQERMEKERRNQAGGSAGTVLGTVHGSVPSISHDGKDGYGTGYPA